MEKHAAFLRQAARSAIHGNALPVAVRVGAGFRRSLGIELQVVSHEKVELPIAVVIHPGAPGSPATREEQPGLLGDVRKGAVAVIPIEDVLPPVSYEDVLI